MKFPFNYKSLPTVAALAALLINPLAGEAAVDPTTARIRTVNLLTGDAEFVKVSLLRFNSTPLAVKLGKSRSFSVPAGNMTFGAMSNISGEEIISPSAFPNTHVAGHDYTFVLNRFNDSNMEPACLSLDLDRSALVPSAGNGRVILLHVSNGSDTLLLGVNSAPADTNFQFGEVHNFETAPGKLHLQLLNVPQGVLLKEVYVKVSAGKVHYVIFGGTSDPTDSVPSIVNVYRSKL